MGNEASSRAQAAKRYKERHPEIPPEVKNFDFPFENLAFAGGGSRTYTYVGACKIMDEIGMLKQIKKFAGTSGGAIFALLLAIGCDMEEVIEAYTIDFNKLASDAFMGCCSLVPNMVRRFGWNPGDRFTNHMRSIVMKKLGKPDITFGQLYKEQGTELCIVACDVSTQKASFCHPKTTPNMSILEAVRMSVSIPGVFQPVVKELEDGIHYYVDGGVLCNYPLYAYDGWYLSMKPEDVFLNKLGEEEDRFGEYNDKTLGFISYPTGMFCTSYMALQKRYDGVKLERPNTKLAKKRARGCDKMLKELEDRHIMIHAAKAFWTALHESDTNGDSLISNDEFKLAVTKVEQHHLDVLFGQNFHADEVFKELDLDGNGQLTHDELIRFMDSRNFPFRAAIEDAIWPSSVKGIFGYTAALLNSIDATLVGLTIKPRDVHRTVGIHTDYIDATDFALETKDREFILERGEIATLAFLKEYVQKHSNCE